MLIRCFTLAICYPLDEANDVKFVKSVSKFEMLYSTFSRAEQLVTLVDLFLELCLTTDVFLVKETFTLIKVFLHRLSCSLLYFDNMIS